MKTSNFYKRVATPTFYVMMCKWQAYSVFSLRKTLLFRLNFDKNQRRTVTDAKSAVATSLLPKLVRILSFTMCFKDLSKFA